MVTLRNLKGEEIEAHGEVVEALSHTVMAFFQALQNSTSIMKVLLEDHVNEQHGGDWSAPCGMLMQVAYNEKVIEFGALAQANLGAGNETCH